MSKWTNIEEFPNYEISDAGEVRLIDQGILKSKRINSRGYVDMKLYKDGKGIHKKVHRLVAEAFLPKIDGKNFVNHKDGNKLNNNVNNLEWCTRSENMKHAYATGLAKPSRSMLGRSNPNAGRKGIPIRIIETGEVFESSLDCERKMGLDNRHINDCLKGRQQTHGGYHFEYV